MGQSPVPEAWCVSKGVPRQAEVDLGVPGRLRPHIISTTRVVGRQPYAPAAFTSGEIPGTHFQRLSRPHGTWFCRKETRNKSQVTPPGIDPETARLVAQRLNHYATPGPETQCVVLKMLSKQPVKSMNSEVRRRRQKARIALDPPAPRLWRCTELVDKSSQVFALISQTDILILSSKLCLVHTR